MDQPAISLLDRPTYGLAEVDRLLGLRPSTARRWIDGYDRGGKHYPPVVRVESSSRESVTWGEFVETRLLSEYRKAGVPIVRMRPAVERLREELNTAYPLAHAWMFLEVEGRELVRRVQGEVKLEAPLSIVVVRNDQLVLADAPARFVAAAEFGEERVVGERRVTGDERVVERLYPRADLQRVVLDPLRRSGQPVVRSVPTEVIAEQFRAGDTIRSIAEAYNLGEVDVEAALRYELTVVTDEVA